MIEKLPAHAPLWEKLQRSIRHKSFPQALLFMGPVNHEALAFAQRFVMGALCQNENKPCGDCRSCFLLLNNIHPDVYPIKPAEKGEAIKIEQIREIQKSLYQTPHIGNFSAVVIEEAHFLNLSAANALLKVLEEPPSHVLFILTCSEINSIPITVLSRCQKYILPSPIFSFCLKKMNWPLSLLENIGTFSSAQYLKLQTDLYDLVIQKISVSDMTSSWGTFSLEELLNLFYLLAAEMIYCYHLKGQPISEPIQCLNKYLSLSRVFNILHHIVELKKKLKNNINLNNTLALEVLLLAFLENN